MNPLVVLEITTASSQAALEVDQWSVARVHATARVPTRETSHTIGLLCSPAPSGLSGPVLDPEKDPTNRHCPGYPRNPKSLPGPLPKIRLDFRRQIKQAADAGGIHEWTIINSEKGRWRPTRRFLDNLFGVYLSKVHP